MAKHDQEKTEAPTPKRKREARKEGQIPKSTEFGIWLQLLVATVAVQLTMNQGLTSLRGIRTDITVIAAEPDPTAAVGVLGRGMAAGLIAVLPLAVGMAIIGVVAMASQTGLVLATKAAKPKFSKVNPLEGFRRLFKPAGLWQGAKSATKVSILALVSWRPILDITHELLDSGQPTVSMSASAVADTAISMTRTVALVGLVLAAADYAVQRRIIGKQLKMSKKEIREESKMMEGDPMVKGQIRRRQQEMSRNRMLAAIPDASVVIVNPTHVAVAIRYKPGSGAPTLVAKGRGVIADRIREEAAKHFVPIVRDVPLARTLEKSCKLDQVIPADLYEAVAKLLAFVMQVGRKAALLGGVLHNPHEGNVPMPDDARQVADVSAAGI